MAAIGKDPAGGVSRIAYSEADRQGRDFFGNLMVLFGKMYEEAEQIASASGTRFSFKEIVADLPALTDPRLRQIIADSAKQLNLTTKSLPSGATHDAQRIARIAPSA